MYKKSTHQKTQSSEVESSSFANLPQIKQNETHMNLHRP